MLFYLDHAFMCVEVLLEISMHLSLSMLRLPLSGHLPKETMISGVRGGDTQASSSPHPGQLEPALCLGPVHYSWVRTLLCLATLFAGEGWCGIT